MQQTVNTISSNQVKLLQKSINESGLSLDPAARSQQIKDKISRLNETRTKSLIDFNRYQIISNNYLNRINKTAKSGSGNPNSVKQQAVNDK